MGKIERENTLALVRLRFHEAGKHWRVLHKVFWVGLLLGTLFSITTGDNLSDIAPPVFMNYTMSAAIIFALRETLRYGENNRLLAMFPQTNRSRFWSYVLLMHGVGFAFVGFGVLLYAVSYPAFALLMQKMGVLMAYPFHLGILLGSAGVALAIVFVAISLLAFVEALYQYLGAKFYLAVLLVGVFFLIQNSAGIRLIARFVLPFWTEESNLWVFYAKMFFAWLLLLGMAGWLTERTSYYKRRSPMSRRNWLVYAFLAVGAIALSFYADAKFSKAWWKDAYSEGTAPGEEERLVAGKRQEGGQEWQIVELQIPEGASYTECWISPRFWAMAEASADCPEGTVKIEYILPDVYCEGVLVSEVQGYEMAAEFVEEGQMRVSYDQPEDAWTWRFCYLSPCGSWMNAFDAFQNQGLYRPSNQLGDWTIVKGYVVVHYPVGHSVEVFH